MTLSRARRARLASHPSQHAILRAMRYFNTTGPVRAAEHYCIPPLERVDLDDLLRLIGEQRYFVLHAPRQTGKTSMLLALRDLLNKEDRYRCLYVNVELAQASRENIEEAMRAVLSSLGSQVRMTFNDEAFGKMWPASLETSGPSGALAESLMMLSQRDTKPLVLLIDEIDALVGDSLLAVLRQLRAGYPDRPDGFPQSVVLCGVRDVRDYRIHAGSGKEVIAGGSPFNIKAESLRVGDFSESNVRALLAQHSEECGQAFSDEALDLIWSQTRGQPWLVNALAYEACFRSKSGRDRNRVIDADAIHAAREQIVVRREAHLDQLAEKLREDRVRRVIEPILSGTETSAFSDRDLEYVRDLGLVAANSPLRIANPVYAEVVPRVMTYAVQEGLVQDTAWYVDAEGGLEVEKLLAAFQSFFREHSEHWVGRFDYREAGPQLLLQAFLQRVVNGGGRIDREYGLGRGRTDLLIVWPQGERAKRWVVECKLVNEGKGLESTIAGGVGQTLEYLDRVGGECGHLVVFDRRPQRSWGEKIFRREERVGDQQVVVWGM
ncbi:MAG: AAA-like domain-containing protein [Gammaproteobacteria bacterium]|nr:AAA-like domain-containing protein [Gammaproteobacteria bacterium]